MCVCVCGGGGGGGCYIVIVIVIVSVTRLISNVIKRKSYIVTSPSFFTYTKRSLG